jgi:hypothetical protein
MRMSPKIMMTLAFASATVCAATPDTMVSSEDVSRLIPQKCTVGRLLPWGKGVLFHHTDGNWWTASWENIHAKPLAAPDFSDVLDVYRSGNDHFVCVRKERAAQIFKWEKDRWIEVQVPESLSTQKAPEFIPSNTGLAFGYKDRVWWERDHVWNETEVRPCPSMLRGGGHSGLDIDPLGDSRIIKFGFLYAGSYGGEFGSAFASYDLSQNNGSWVLVWREAMRPSVQRLFQDQEGSLWAFAQLGHMGGFEYELHRRKLTQWEMILQSTTSSEVHAEVRTSPDALQKDSLVVDAALMPDGRIALLSQDEGIYVKVKGGGPCPCLFHFDFVRRHGYEWPEGRMMCFDDAGNAYVNTLSLGFLVFHKSAEGGPWRVKQVELPVGR